MNETQISDSSSGAGIQHIAGKYLTFNLQDELYGIEILKVQEIIGVMPITSVPKAPPEIKGVINLRGRVIPVVDLRLKLGMPAIEYGELSCIVVINVPCMEQEIAVGVVVDSVREVFDLNAQQLEPAPRFGMDVDASTLLAIGKIDECVILLLDIDQVMGGESSLHELATSII